MDGLVAVGHVEDAYVVESFVPQGAGHPGGGLAAFLGGEMAGSATDLNATSSVSSSRAAGISEATVSARGSVDNGNSLACGEGSADRRRRENASPSREFDNPLDLNRVAMDGNRR